MSVIQPGTGEAGWL